MQNTGLPQKEAELARQRDFDDIFFFAGASDEEVGRFLTEGPQSRPAIPSARRSLVRRHRPSVPALHP